MKALITIAAMLLIVGCISVDGTELIEDAIDKISGTEQGDNNEQTIQDTEESEEGSDSESAGTTTIESGSDIPSNRKFIATFERAYTYNTCEGFPKIGRLYSYGGYLYLDSNTGDNLFVAKFFEDGTFDFQVDVIDGFGMLANEYTCTCTYDASDYYGDEFECECDGCSLKYREFD